MAQRTYLPSLKKVSRELCRLVFFADPIIRRVYPNNPTLIAALDAANIACRTLVEEIDDVLPIGD